MVTHAQTGRKLAKADVLRLHDEMLRNMTEGIFLVRAGDGVIVYANPRFERMFGYEPGEMIGKHVSIVNAPTDKAPQETAREILGILNKTGEWHGEVHNIKKDGTPFWCYVNISVFKHAQYGKVYLSVHTDITDRKRTEDALRLFRSLVDQSNDAIEVVDPETGRFLDVNQKGLLDLGYRRDEFLALSVFDIDPLVTPSVFAKGAEELRKSGVLTWKSIHRRKDGSTFPVEVNLKYIRLERDYVIAVVRDITARKQVEDWERLARQVLELLNHPQDAQNIVRDILQLIKRVMGFEAAGIRFREGDDYPYFVTQGFSEQFIRKESRLCRYDSQGQIIRDRAGNPVLECMCGNILCERYDPAKPYFTTQGSFWTNYTTKLLSSAPEALCQSRMRNLCQSAGYESVALIPLRSDGKIIGLLQFNDRRPNQFTLEMIQFFEGLSPSIAIALRRMQTRADLKKSNLALQAALKQLQDIQEQVIQQERLNALGQMAAGIAHDFNNALIPVLGYTELLLSRQGILDNRKETIEMLKLTRSGAINAAETVHRLGEFSRPGELSQQQPVDLARVIQDTVALTRPKWKVEMETKGVTIDLRTEIAPVAPIPGDEHEFGQLLTNLIFNAVDAIPREGSITIRLHSHDSGKHAVIEVQDTGVGMSEEVRRRCLDPFFSTKTGRGMGLGLSIAYGIVQRHKGSIEIQSEPGKGTRVIVQLPLDEASAMKSQEEKPPSDLRPPIPPLRVLIVDDEEAVRDVLSRYLEADGHTVRLAAGGQAGLQLFESESFDMVILDRAMPGMNGDALAAAIKSRSPQTPVIMLTGFGDLLGDQGGRPLRVDKIVAKPLTRETLRRAMAEVIADKQTAT